MPKAHHMVILGGGIAGLDLASQLSGRPLASGERLSITLVDREPAHVWKPMLHTIAAGTRDVDQQQTAYVAQARERRFMFHPGEVRSIERGARKVQLAPWVSPQGEVLIDAHEIDYDTLVLALGSRANDFGTTGVAEYCFSIDSRSQAIAFNEALRIAMLQSLVRNISLDIGIVGGGATGVELAAELVRLVDLAKYYGANMAGKVKVTLLESGKRLLASFPERIALAARDRLETLGVSVHTNTRVTQADPDGFRLSDGSRIKARLKIWAAGVKAPDPLSTLEGLELTHNNQVIVGPTLRTTRDPGIFAVGDCASATLRGDQHPLPPTAQVARQQSRYLIRYLPALLAGKTVPDFKYHDFGSLISLGGYDAFGSLGKFGFFKGGFIRGRVAQLGHAMLYRSHQVDLHGFWRGSLLWLVDRINAKVRPSIQLE